MIPAGDRMIPAGFPGLLERTAFHEGI